MVNVKETTVEEITEKLSTMKTELTKIDYLESALKKDFTFEAKRFLWNNLIDLYEERKMYEKAARSMSQRAGIDVTFREKIESYLKAAEFYVRCAKIEDAEDMFIRATRNANEDQKAKILFTRKNIYLAYARALEKAGKKTGASKFYEKLLTIRLEEIEKKEVKENLLAIYKSLGKFKEAELLGRA